MKNKKMSTLLASIVIFGVSAPVFAANITHESTQKTSSMNVSYGVGATYTISIPESVDFTTNISQNVNVVASGVLIEEGNVLKVDLTSANGFKLKCQDSEIVYSVTKDGVEFSDTNTEVLSVEAGEPTSTFTEELQFSTTNENIQAATLSGQHSDTLTFTVSVQ